MKLRLIAGTVILTLMGVLTLTPFSAGATHAATGPQAGPTRTLGVTGLPTDFTAQGSSTVLGTLTSLQITKFGVVDGVLTAFGTATYTPAGSTDSVTSTFSAPVDPPASCSILSLKLGPIFLDVLGLQVTTNEIDLNITAVPGPGNLLGNLLCSIAHLLDNGGGNGLTAAINNLVAVLNQILAGL